MDIVVSSKDRIRDVNDLSFCEKFRISLNRVRLNGKRGITQSEFAKKIALSESSISKVKKCERRPNDRNKQGNSRAKKEMQSLIDKVFL